MDVDEIRNEVPIVVYCWGNMAHGQLGLGGIEEEQISEPRELTALTDKRVTDVACGVYHTVFLLKSGVVYSCGNNDHGQLGHDKARSRPGVFHLLCHLRRLWFWLGGILVFSGRGQMSGEGCLDNDCNHHHTATE